MTERFYAVVEWPPRAGFRRFTAVLASGDEERGGEKVVQRCPTWAVARRIAEKLQRQHEAEAPS